MSWILDLIGDAICGFVVIILFTVGAYSICDSVDKFVNWIDRWFGRK